MLVGHRWQSLLLSCLCFLEAVQFSASISVANNATKLPTERARVTLKSWRTVKDAMQVVSDEVLQIEAIRSDMSSLQNDMKKQESVWHEGERQLVEQNENLRAQVAALQRQVQDGAGILQRVQLLKQSIQDESRKLTSLQQQQSHDADQQDLEKRFLQERQQNLTIYLESLNETAKTQVHDQQHMQMQLETDAVGLRLRVAQLESVVRDKHKRLQVQADMEGHKVQDLKKQLTTMEEAMAKLHAQLADGPTEATLAVLDAQVQDEMRKLAAIQQSEVEAESSCDRQVDDLKKVREAEFQKSTSQKSDTDEYCGKVKAQNAALQQMVILCEGNAAA